MKILDNLGLTRGPLRASPPIPRLAKRGQTAAAVQAIVQEWFPVGARDRADESLPAGGYPESLRIIPVGTVVVLPFLIAIPPWPTTVFRGKATRPATTEGPRRLGQALK